MGTRLCMCSAALFCYILDLLPNVLSKSLSISVVFVLLALSLKPGKMGLNKGFYMAWLLIRNFTCARALLQLLGSAQTFEVF